MNANSQRPKISACIISMNEEDRIEECIASLDFCDEVLVVDSHSSDNTRELAEALGARVIERDWPGHVKQKEFTIRAATHDWVLCVDSDERISPPLREQIITLRDAGFVSKDGWNMPRLCSYLGGWIRHGNWYPDRQLRLFHRERGHWGGHDPHDRVQMKGPVGELAGDLIHHPYRAFSDHLHTMDKYTTIMAQGLYDRGKRSSMSKVVFHPTWKFLRFYFVKRAFLDGWRGLLLAYLAAHYTRLKYAKLLVLEREQARPEL
jgi:glycosyltransferase involved in cell wall biosynthesis